ncbi:MAG: hypothetical protein SWK76_15090 [Actinomycetota bacterium]|nr:hypothetical protein [Actinomycetota bacterium]
MPGCMDSRARRPGHILLGLCFTLLLALTTALILPGCGGDDAAVETEEETGVTAPKYETEEGEDDSQPVEEDEDYEPVEEEEAVELSAEYTNDIYGYSLSYPGGWECEEVEKGNGCCISQPGNDYFVALAWALPSEGKSAQEWLDHLYTTVKNEYGAGGTGVWMIERDPSNAVSDTYDGADYMYEYWTYEAAGEEYYYDVMVMVDGGEVFYFTAQYPVDQVDEIDPIVGAMLDSFTLP